MRNNVQKWVREPARAAWELVFNNPVVVRDLRAQMRGTKSYWYQGAYLLLLGILAVTGYAQSTQQGMGGSGTQNVNIVDAQGQLSQMYYFIFGTIAALILLIAPALTAASIVGERQRLSFDLLVTTPLKASELLVGKLISSVAFLGLLLCLSLPAASLCVILGGATLADVFRTYVQFAIDGAVLAAVGLFFSCASKTNLLAVLWSYVAVGVGFGITLAMSDIGRLDSACSALLPFATLNPIVTITANIGGLVPASGALHSGVGSFEILGLHLPTLLCSAVIAVLVIRLLLTAATFRLGVYGAQSATSLRRQVLGMTALVSFVVAASAFAATGMPSVYTVNHLGMDMAAFVIVAFMLIAVFLPALFVPASPNEDLPGGLHRQIAADSSPFRLRKVFQPVHSGAYPYFLLCMATIVFSATVAAGIALAKAGLLTSSTGVEVAGSLLVTFLYVAALGFLLFQISRFAAAIVKTLSGGRGLAFGIFAIVAAFPLMLMALSGAPQPETTPIAYGFLFYPLMASDASHPEIFLDAILISTGVSLALAFLFAFFRRAVLARAETRANRAVASAA